MSKYKVLYVDEDPADIRRFQLYVHKKDSDKEFEIIPLIPENTLENFIELISEDGYDAIVTDHKLNEQNASISFDGIDLVRAILSQKLDFPCFVLTSFDDEAIMNGDDVNIVYVKGIMDEDGENKVHATFLDKIKHQINHHRAKIESARSELEALIQKEYRDAKDEDRVNELDTYLEKTASIQSTIPVQLKSESSLEVLRKMITNTDELLMKIRG